MFVCCVFVCLLCLIVCCIFITSRSQWHCPSAHWSLAGDQNEFALTLNLKPLTLSEWDRTGASLEAANCPIEIRFCFLECLGPNLNLVKATTKQTNPKVFVTDTIRYQLVRFPTTCYRCTVGKSLFAPEIPFALPTVLFLLVGSIFPSASPSSPSSSNSKSHEDGLLASSFGSDG